MGGYGSTDRGMGNYGSTDRSIGGYGSTDRGMGSYGSTDRGMGNYGSTDRNIGGYGSTDRGMGNYGSTDRGLGGYGSTDRSVGDYGATDRGIDMAMAPAEAPMASPSPVPASQCDETDCGNMYQQCGGGNLEYVICCEEGTVCVKKHQWCGAANMLQFRLMANGTDDVVLPPQSEQLPSTGLCRNSACILHALTSSVISTSCLLAPVLCLLCMHVQGMNKLVCPSYAS